jgi:heterodisulfide reductase subunit B
MNYALFLGCTIPARLTQYESSSRAVLGALGVELIDIKEFNCCGYPLRNIDFKASILASARNIALAEKEGLPMLILCKCGFGTLKHADHILKEDSSLRNEINTILKKEGLEYTKGVEIKHLLSVLYHDIDRDTLTKKITRPFKNLKIATHYGCHALRPSEITQFDDPVNPTLFDDLVTLTGAESIDWEKRLDCCGAPLTGVNDDLSMDLTGKKLANAKQSGADFLCDACSYCHIQFDTVQGIMNNTTGTNNSLPAILYPHLLGLCLGIDGDTLGLGENTIDITRIEGYLTE